ncbi:MAG: TrkA family potassium uptake protein [Syntrophobacteraceae bacterium]
MLAKTSILEKPLLQLIPPSLPRGILLMGSPLLEGHYRPRQTNFHLIIRILIIITTMEIACFSLSVVLLSTFENLTLFRALYLAVVTVFTVGYGDVYPVTNAGMMTVYFLLFTGVGFISTLSSIITTLLIEGYLISIWREKSMQTKIARLRNHVIICGLGRAGSSAIAQLRKDGRAFVGIDRNEHLCNQLEDQGELVLLGDATEDNVLEKASIAYASSLIAVLPEDADNMLVSMAAKDLNKDIRVVARSTRKENEKRLMRAGADWVVTLGFTGGARLAMAAVRPATVSFLDDLFNWSNQSLKLEEFLVENNCVLANKIIAESCLREISSVRLLALVRNEQTIANPSEAEHILPGDIIIVFGTPEGVNELGKQIGVFPLCRED